MEQKKNSFLASALIQSQVILQPRFFKIELSIKYLFILHLIFKFQHVKIEEILIFESYPFVITDKAFRLKVQTFFKNKEQRIYEVEFHL